MYTYVKLGLSLDFGLFFIHREIQKVVSSTLNTLKKWISSTLNTLKRMFRDGVDNFVYIHIYIIHGVKKCTGKNIIYARISKQKHKMDRFLNRIYIYI